MFLIILHAYLRVDYCIIVLLCPIEVDVDVLNFFWLIVPFSSLPLKCTYIL
ncbi:unnamed protein product [Camellia sinensis]